VLSEAVEYPKKQRQSHTVAVAFRHQGMGSSQVEIPWKATKIFRPGNRDGSHPEAIVSPSPQTDGGFCLVPVPVDEASTPRP